MGAGKRLRDERLDGAIYFTLKEAQVFIEDLRRHDAPSARTAA